MLEKEASHCASTAHPPMRRKWLRMNMFYFYALRFKSSSKLYYDFTENLRRRIKEHRSKSSNFTSKNGEFDLIFYEAYLNKTDARNAEIYFKSGHGREVLKGKLKNYLGSVA